MQIRFLWVFWISLLYRSDPITDIEWARSCGTFTNVDIYFGGPVWTGRIVDFGSEKLLRDHHEKCMRSEAAIKMHYIRIKQKIAASKTKYHTYP